MKTITQHIEQYLGQIEHGWTKNADGEILPFQVAACKNGVIKDVTAFVTLGVSRIELVSPVSLKPIRQELLMTARSEYDAFGMPNILQQLAIEAVRSGTAYLRGDVIGPRGSIFKGSSIEAFYVTIPTYYPESFSVFKESEKNHIVLAWLVPISSEEAQYVRSHGWNAFESLLEINGPDLLDLKRESVK